MSATAAAVTTPVVTEATAPQSAPATEPKHAAEKASRFHLPTAVSSRLEARALRQGIEAEQTPASPTSHRLTKEAKAARKTAVRETKVAAKTAAKAARKIVTEPATLRVVPMTTIRESFQVAPDGETTPVFSTLLGTYANGATRTGEVLGDLATPSLFASLFETAEQRARRVNIASVANVLLMTASVAGKVAAARAGRK